MVFEDMKRDDCFVKKEKSILDRLGIPVTHLDFKYVENCKDPIEVEKILRVLKSGEEGFYPEFQDYVQKRLETLNPRSRYLRVETPALRSDLLEKSERLEIENDLSEWLVNSQKNEIEKQIFSVDDTKEPNVHDQPIRGPGGVVTNIETKKKTNGSGDGFLKPKNPDRIKSWDYDKWDKFNVDAELTKLEIEEMRRDELKKTKGSANKTGNSSSISKEIQVQPTLLVDDKKNVQPIPSSSKHNCNYTPGRLGRSFIEEISGGEDEAATTHKIQGQTLPTLDTKKPQPKANVIPREQQPLILIQEMPNSGKSVKEGKRVKIIIDDLRVG